MFLVCLINTLISFCLLTWQTRGKRLNFIFDLNFQIKGKL